MTGHFVVTEKEFGRAHSGRAIRYKSSLVPRCGLFATIPHAKRTIQNTRPRFVSHEPKLELNLKLRLIPVGITPMQCYRLWFFFVSLLLVTRT